MNLDDFRFMYYMEYAHVLWGRSLGVMFGVPFSYFLLKRYITLRLGLRLSGIFALCAGQGLIGWWTAKSGSEVKAKASTVFIFTLHNYDIAFFPNEKNNFFY